MSMCFITFVVALTYEEDHWVVESEDIHKLWYNHIYHGKQPNPHLKRHPFHALNPQHLKLTIGPETSIIVKDKKMNETILIVMWNTCRDEGAVLSVDAAVTDETKQKSVRVSEPFGFLHLISSVPTSQK
jgi:hypothetical protein